MTDINTQNQVQTFGDWATIALGKHARKIFKYEANVLKDKDPEDLHQMRVGMRRLRTAIVGFDRAIDLPSSVTEKSIGKFAKTLGSLRDLDVLQEAISSQYQPLVSSPEQKQLDWVLKALKKRRKSSLKRVRDLLTGDRYKALKQDLQKWIARPKYETIAQVSIDAVLPDLLLPEMAYFLLHPGWWLGVELTAGTVSFHDPLDPEAVRELLERQGLILHDLRKEAKRTRYQMELFTDRYGERYQTFVQQVKQVQDVLGQIQDGFVFSEFLSDSLGTDVQTTMPELAARLTETRYQQWQEWEKLQRLFLDTQTRKDFRAIVEDKS
ncbi:MAG: CHAD domain-containing protein [Geitlerinemataceae cyanobacterium]